MPSLLTKKQFKIYAYWLRYKPIINILEGAVRSGKTILDNFLWYNHVKSFEDKGYKFIMTGATIPSLKRNVLDDLENDFNIDTTLNKNNEFQMLGNTIACFGASKSDSYKPIKGFTAHGWYGNEITEHHRKTTDQCIKRCSGEGAHLFLDTNPDNPDHYFKTDFIDKTGTRLSNGALHIKSWHFTLDDNEFLPFTYMESLKKATPTGHFYDRDILGLWVSAQGMIYKDFDYSKHIIEKAPEGLTDFFAGVDWGYKHFGVIGVYGRDGDGNVYRLFEIAEQEKDIDFWVYEAKRIKAEYGNIPFYCDTNRIDHVNKFRNNRINAIGANKAVVEGITFVCGLFKNDNFYVVRDKNKLWISEIYNYRWREGGVDEAPIKENDDAMDESRYALFTHLNNTRIIKPSNISASDLGL